MSMVHTAVYKASKIISLLGLCFIFKLQMYIVFIHSFSHCPPLGPVGGRGWAPVAPPNGTKR